MSDALYTNMQATAKRLIEKRGRTIRLKKKEDGDYDPATGLFSGGSEESVSVKAFFRAYRKDEIDGTLIQKGDIMLLFAHSDVTAVAADFDPDDFDAVDFNTVSSGADNNPKIEHDIIDGSTIYNIKDIEPLQPGDTILFYRVQARK